MDWGAVAWLELNLIVLLVALLAAWGQEKGYRAVRFWPPGLMR